MVFLTDKLYFPPAHTAASDGLIAIGGDLSIERLQLAYSSGIFPWYDDDDAEILWWCTQPRFVLLPQNLRISKSMKQIINANKFQFTFNTAFEQVISHCKTMQRKDQQGTWITNEMEAAYTAWHKQGGVVSAEAWQEGKLVGGLYGVLLQRVFCGESMFATVSNASKFAFIKLVQLLQTKGIELIDCQMHTTHLESLGAGMMPLDEYLSYLKAK